MRKSFLMCSRCKCINFVDISVYYVFGCFRWCGPTWAMDRGLELQCISFFATCRSPKIISSRKLNLYLENAKIQTIFGKENLKNMFHLDFECFLFDLWSNFPFRQLTSWESSNHIGFGTGFSGFVLVTNYSI